MYHFGCEVQFGWTGGTTRCGLFWLSDGTGQFLGWKGGMDVSGQLKLDLVSVS
jgi:hypothetical protein